MATGSIWILESRDPRVHNGVYRYTYTYKQTKSPFISYSKCLKWLHVVNTWIHRLREYRRASIAWIWLIVARHYLSMLYTLQSSTDSSLTHCAVTVFHSQSLFLVCRTTLLRYNSSVWSSPKSGRPQPCTNFSRTWRILKRLQRHEPQL